MGDWIARLARDRREGARALDVAMGGGRHTLALAAAGYRAFGVDVRLDAIREAVRAAWHGALALRAWCADVGTHPLPAAWFDVIVVARFLDRALFPAIAAAVAPGGVVLYETFTTAQRALGRGPRSPAHLLEPGELRSALPGFDELFYEEVASPDAVARFAARRPR